MIEFGYQLEMTLQIYKLFNYESYQIDALGASTQHTHGPRHDIRGDWENTSRQIQATENFQLNGKFIVILHACSFSVSKKELSHSLH